MGGSSKSQTVGYKYYVGMHMALTHGPVDKLLQVKVDDREAWSAEQSGPAQLYINKPDLFGGESREGGIQGTFDFETGHPSQGQNSYLLSKLGSYVPAFRGICGIVLRQMFMGLNPYLKVWKFRISRVHVRQKGIVQWYDAKSEIVNYSDELGQQLNPRSTGWKYIVTGIADLTDCSSPSYDDSSWPSGQTPFGSPSDHPYAANSFFPKDPITYWTEAAGSKIWVRKHFTVSTYRDYNISVYGDNFATVFVNGVMLLNDAGGHSEKFQYDIRIPKEILNVGGDNVIAAWCRGLGGWSYFAFKWGSPQYDMNPAHIIRECLTDPDWGMGYQDADIDDASFMAAADRLYDEQMGMSLIWDTQTNIEEFIKIVVKHIDAALYVERTTGKFVLKLIRNDYDVNSLITLDESNIDKISDFTRPSFGELTNSVTVTFWDFSTGEDSTLTVQDIALSQMQGCTINTAVQYPGFTTAALATRVAQRDLKTLSTPLATCTIYANRDAASLNIGKCFKLTWADYEVSNLVMRVTGIAYGDGKSNRVRINCVQDIFTLPDNAFIQPTPPAWIDPTSSPIPVVARKVFEIPYLELVQTVGQSDIDTTLAATPEVGYVGAAAVRTADAISARMFDDLGSGYVEVGNLDFSPGATLDGDINESVTTFAIKDGFDLDQVQLNTWFELDSEIMAVTAISATSVTVKRGCLDTTPKKHLSGAYLVFWDNYAQGDNTELVSSEIAKVKICTVTGGGQLTLAEAPEDTVTIVGRAARPYPPANVKINTAYFPAFIEGADLALTWVHRDRKQQTASLVGFTEASIGPEAGTTYEINFYNENGTLVKTETAISGTSFEWITEEADSGVAVEVLTFTPSSLFSSGEKGFWLDASDFTTMFQDTAGTLPVIAIGQSVKLIRDKSGNGNHFTQANNAPTLQKDATGNYYLDFNGTSQFLTRTGDAALRIGTNSISYCIGAKYNTVSGFPLIQSPISRSFAGNLPGRYWNGVEPSTNQYSGYHQEGGSGSKAFASTAPTAITVISGLINRNAGTNLLRFDGTQVGSASFASDSATNHTDDLPTRLGAYNSTNSAAGDSGSNFFNGRIYQAVVVYRNLSSEELISLEDYISSKSQQAPDSAGYRKNGKIRVTLESLRDGMRSFQKHDHTLERTGYGFNYGKRYGE